MYSDSKKLTIFDSKFRHLKLCCFKCTICETSVASTYFVNAFPTAQLRFCVHQPPQDTPRVIHTTCTMSDRIGQVVFRNPRQLHIVVQSYHCTIATRLVCDFPTGCAYRLRRRQLIHSLAHHHRIAHLYVQQTPFSTVRPRPTNHYSSGHTILIPAFAATRPSLEPWLT
jgi:hypothetical protein